MSVVGGWMSLDTVPAGMFFYSFDLGEPETSEQREKRVQAERERQYKRRALVSLWSRVLADLRIRHPDPRVGVQHEIRALGEGVEITFSMSDLHDTGAPDKFISDGGFVHRGAPKGWPGYHAARQYISALWSLYLMHEAQELVTHRGSAKAYSAFSRRGGVLGLESRVTEIPVIDPHSEGGANQIALATTSDVVSTLDWGLGLGNGKKLVDSCASRAEEDLANEIEFVSGRVARWE